MALGMTRNLGLSYEKAVEMVTEALRKEGFGVLTEIDVKAVLKKKIDKDFKRYVILGACNPNFAYRGLSTDGDIGLLLPCNVIVYEDGQDKSIVSIVNPEILIGVLGNDKLHGLASEVGAALKRVFEALG